MAVEDVVAVDVAGGCGFEIFAGVKAFVSDKHRLKNMNIETWVTPAWGFQFFIRSEFKHINAKIERAILDADERGVKVLGLGAFE